MRIITGDFKGRRLEMPADNNIRPTSEKVKEAFFSIIGTQVDGAICVDLFAGTGNLGLEAISRGAERCYFGDNSRTSIELVNRNISMCRAEEWSHVIAGDFEKVLNRVAEREGSGRVDIIFLDPPYKRGFYQRCFELIEELNLLSEGGIIVAEHDASDDLSESIGRFSKVKERSYGSIEISIYC